MRPGTGKKQVQAKWKDQALVHQIHRNDTQVKKSQSSIRIRISKITRVRIGMDRDRDSTMITGNRNKTGSNGTIYRTQTRDITTRNRAPPTMNTITR